MKHHLTLTLVLHALLILCDIDVDADKKAWVKMTCTSLPLF